MNDIIFYPALWRIKKYFTRLDYFIYNFSTCKNKNPFGKIEKYFTKHKNKYFYKSFKFLNYGNYK